MSSIVRLIMKIFVRGASDKYIDSLSKKEAMKEIEPTQQYEYVLKVPKFTKVAFIVTIIGLLGFTIGYAFYTLNSGIGFNSDSIAGLSVLGGCAIILIPFYIDQRSKYVALSNSLVEGYSVFKKQTEFRWNDITSVEFLDRKQMKIKTTDQQVIVYKAYTGSLIALRLVFQKLDPEVYLHNLVRNKTYFNMLLLILTEEEKELLKKKLVDLGY